MSDILPLVQELNRLAALDDVQTVGPYVRARCKEAADEIGRLREQVEILEAELRVTKALATAQ